MKKHTLIFCFLLCCAGWWAGTPAGKTQTLNADKPQGEIERSMEANLNWNLQNALLLYYPETKFVVNAKVKLSRVEPKRILPGLPDALLSKDLTNLPGLPYIPPELSKPIPAESESANLLTQVKNIHYKVDRILLDVLVDQSLTESDWSFIRRFATLTANLDPVRGDRIRIESAEFPEKSTFYSNQTASVPEEQSKSTSAFPQTPSPLFDWFPYLFAAGLAILLLILFLVGQHNIAKQLKKSGNQNSLTAVPADSRLEIAESKQIEQTDEKDKALKVVEVYKTTAIDAIVGSPTTSAKVLNGWIDRDGETAYFEIAVLFSTVSISLLNLVEPYLGEERSEAVHKQSGLLSESDIDQNSEKALRKFDKDVRKIALQEKFDNNQDALSFLHQMSDNQLLHLLKPLKIGVMAIVLAQLRSNRAAKILGKLDSQDRKSVLASMGNIERIPVDVYQHVARQLASRAQELKKMRHVRADGVEALVKVMDHLDERSQSEAIEYLQTQDVSLAKKVRKQFLTFEDFIQMPSEKLRQAALGVDREVLAKSLITLDEEAVANIVNSLPAKLGEMVRASLESNQNVPEKEVTEARRALMRSLRTKNSHQILT